MSANAATIDRPTDKTGDRRPVLSDETQRKLKSLADKYKAAPEGREKAKFYREIMALLDKEAAPLPVRLIDEGKGTIKTIYPERRDD